MDYIKAKELTLKKFTNAEILGFISYLITGLLFFVNIKLSILTLIIFLIICFIAPFCPKWSFFLPIISCGNSGENIVALTFDDGPDPVTTLYLLKLLSKYKVKATFFVICKKAKEYPELIFEILRCGHTIGNHSFNHDIFMMMKSKKYIEKEIKISQEIFSKFKIRPLIFRPPVGITNPSLYKILLKNNLYAVNFSLRANDFGNKRINNLSKKILKNIHPDDIIMLHDTAPKTQNNFERWLNEIELILKGIKYKKLKIAPLSKLIDKKLCLKVDSNI